MIVTEMLLVEKTSADFLILLHHSGIQTDRWGYIVGNY